MPQDMPSSWRYLSSARSHVSNIKGYISGRESPSVSRTPRTQGGQQGDVPQSWRAWAGQKIRARKRGMYGLGNLNTEVVNLFPGWAVRRYPMPLDRTNHISGEPQPFELEVLISGYAISYKPPENASRSQRAFLRLAKGYAYLPKLVDDPEAVHLNSSSLARLSPSTEELLATVKLPPRPTEISDNFDMEELERQLFRAKKVIGDGSSGISSSASSSIESLPSLGTSTRAAPPPFANSNLPNEVIRRLHANLEKRLQPFWSSVLPNRTIRLHVFASPHQGGADFSSGSNSRLDDEEDEISLSAHGGPLLSQDVTTTADGSFQLRLKVQWEALCQHPAALHIAFGEAITEHDLLVVAQLLPLTPDPLHSHHSHHIESISPSISSSPLTTLTRIPITHSPIRVISDIDDTIKLSGILQGARAIFHNVFVKDLTDNVIPGMGEWYASMWNKGVRFHYVSNGPFEYLPVLNEFFEISKLPPGSIKLRSYAGRSLFSGLLSAPAARKRAGVVDVLDAFPDSRFFLIGDTGEQDLELYADIARERPDKILAVFVRDADSTTEPLEDPTGWNAIGDAGTRASDRPLVPRSESGISSQDPSPSFSIDSFSKYNNNSVGSPLNPANVDPNRTPRLGIQSKSLGKLSQTYFSNNVLVREPESVGDELTPTIKTFAQMELNNGLQHDHALPPPPRFKSSGSTKFTNQPPEPIKPPSIHNNGFNTLRSSAVSSRSQQSTSSTSSTDSYGKQPLTEAEKRRRDLQLRVYRARTQMPGHVFLRVFRDPKECVEAQQIFDHEREGC